MAFIDREVRHLVGKAIHSYSLIENGDRIAVAVSGGKDSMLLLWLLRERLQRIPGHYELFAVHVDSGFDPPSADALEAFFQREGFAHAVLRTDYGLRAHGPDNRENPCFLCARLRRTALFQTASELGCTKIALGHNQDDLIETFFINICYAGQVAAMVPRQAFFGGEMTVIRPLALVSAAKVERLRERMNLPIVPNPCPSAGRNKRQEVRYLLESLYRGNRKVRGNIFHAMSHVNLEYLPPPLQTNSGDYANLQEFLHRRDS
jgi:tRNA 2-thiocytidine biosynthesis protein TtcA